MSGQVLTSPLHGVGSKAQEANTATHQELRRGKVADDTGKNVPAPAQAPAAEQPDMEDLVERLNLAALNIGHDLHFEVDLDRGLAIIQVLDRQTGDIVRQIPAEKAALAIRENGDFQIRLFDAVV